MKKLFKKHKILGTFIIIFIVINVYSFLPLVKFYLTKTPENFKRNDTVGELKENKGNNFSFIIMSDTGTGNILSEASTLKIIKVMNREDRFKKVPIDFVANIGDITFRGKTPHYTRYVKIKDMIKYPVVDVIGNHDDDIDNGKRGEELFKKYCGEKEFTFIDRNSFFIVLDNKNSEFTEVQFKWLENELKKGSTYAHTFIFMHKPPFNPRNQSWYRIETCPWSYRFLKLCEKYKVDMVFSGHEHAASEHEFGGVKYLITGGGGSILDYPSWEGAYLNYIVIKVNGDYLSYEIRKIQPPAWVYFTCYMWIDLVYFIRDHLL